MENLSTENCYVIYCEKNVIICHFDEILYFTITNYPDMVVYTPYLKNDKTILSDMNESGHEQLKRYIQYKNNAH